MMDIFDENLDVQVAPRASSAKESIAPAAVKKVRKRRHSVCPPKLHAGTEDDEAAEEAAEEAEFSSRVAESGADGPLMTGAPVLEKDTAALQNELSFARAEIKRLSFELDNLVQDNEDLQEHNAELRTSLARSEEQRLAALAEIRNLNALIGAPDDSPLPTAKQPPPPAVELAEVVAEPAERVQSRTGKRLESVTGVEVAVETVVKVAVTAETEAAMAAEMEAASAGPTATASAPEAAAVAAVEATPVEATPLRDGAAAARDRDTATPRNPLPSTATPRGALQSSTPGLAGLKLPPSLTSSAFDDVAEPVTDAAEESATDAATEATSEPPLPPPTEVAEMAEATTAPAVTAIEAAAAPTPTAPTSHRSLRR